MSDIINLSGLLSLLSQQAPFQQLVRELAAPHEGEWRFSVLRAARPFVLSALAEQIEQPILLIAAKPDRTQALYESLRSYGLDTPERLLRFPEPSALFYDRTPWPREVVAERLQVLARLTSDQQPPSTPPLIVTSVRALMFRTLPSRAFRLGTRSLKKNQTANIDQLMETWVGFG